MKPNARANPEKDDRNENVERDMEPYSNVVD